MTQENITHIDILIRQVETEKALQDLAREVAELKENTKNMVAAFNAASGAFVALEWLAKVAKPIIFLVGVIGAGYMAFKGHGV